MSEALGDAAKSLNIQFRPRDGKAVDPAKFSITEPDGRNVSLPLKEFEADPAELSVADIKRAELCAEIILGDQKQEAEDLGGLF